MNSFLISFEIEATLFVEMKTRLILYKLGQTKVRSCQLTVVSSQNRVKSGSRCNSKGIKTCIYRSNRTQRRNFVPSLRQIYQFEDTCIGSINNNQAQRSIVQIYGMEDVSYSLARSSSRSQIHVIRSISIVHLCESNSIATQTSQFVGIHQYS